MRIITLHCDYIKFKPLKKALKSADELKDFELKEVKDPLVVLTSVEEGDNDQTIKELVKNVKKTADEVKAKNIVLYPYAHLSSHLATPDTAKEYLVEAEAVLKKESFNVIRAPFGYYKEFELKCKGHPLSELSKEFGPLHENKDVINAVSKEKITEEKEESIPKILREISRSKLDTSKLKENDHRILGQKLDLFSFNESSPGSVFWHKNGMFIFNELMKFSRELHEQFGYEEISTPQILDNKLWKVSGHWFHYREGMFLTEYEGKSAGIKPMNCPGMMLVYKTKTRSYRDLPVKLFEFGIDHRKELSGVLAGLFRLIKFTQDDAHIFCLKSQIGQEIENVLRMIKIIYKDTFNFDYSLELSTRPEKFMGEKPDWDYAERELENALKKLKVKYKLNKGDGAFYGPKIDIHIKDSLGRDWQCATIQLDMQMPKRFELEFTTKENKQETPLLIHRAIFGSLERFIGILLESTNGALPLWISPIQCRIISFTDRNIKHAEKVKDILKKSIPNLRIDADLNSTTVNEKVRNAEMLRIPYTITIGDKEEEKGTLAVKERGAKPKFGIKMEEFISDIKNKIENRS